MVNFLTLHWIPSPVMATSVGIIMQVRFHWCKHLFSIANWFHIDHTFTVDVMYRLKKASGGLLVISKVSPGDAVNAWTIKLVLLFYYWYCLVLPVGRLAVAIVLVLGIAVAGVVATNGWTRIIIIICMCVNHLICYYFVLNNIIQNYLYKWLDL